MQKTYQQKTSEVVRNWHLVDANGQVLGRIATEIAKHLIGKNKPTYTPHIDAGDYVVVVNAAKFIVTGNKMTQKKYYQHSGYPGGLKPENLEELLERQPVKVIEKAVYNMLPKNKLRSDRMARLKIYVDDQHKHTSQLANKATETEAAE
ncbi:MAG: 50S ribosomal protein L13 [Microgenomates group bacterium]